MDDLLSRFGIDKQTKDTGRGVIRRLQKLRYLYGVIWAELRSKVRLPVRDTLRAWWYGFSRWSYRLYELDRHDPRRFITDRVQSLAPARINGLHRPACDQKVIFSRYVESLGAPCPRIRAVIVRGRIHVLDGTDPARSDWLRALLVEYPPGIVLKPIAGREGFGVAFLRRNGQGYDLNGRAATEDDVEAVVTQLDNYLIADFIVQHEYAAGLYPRTTNTLRLLTLWDYEADRPFLAAVAQRIGTSRSYPVDNFKMGAGGLSAHVDLGTGELGCGVYRPDAGPMQRHILHPETGSPIKGVRVPRWQETVEDILRFSARMPYLPFIGWDVVMTPNGYQIIETNPGSGFYLIQVHQPLLADVRVKRFFEVHGFQ